jgi:hypothetical protein
MNMKKFIALLALGLQLYPALCFSALSAQDLAHIPQNNLLNNPGFESGPAYWTPTTGDTFVTTTSLPNRGNNAAVWTPSASAHVLTANNISYSQNAGPGGSNGVATCRYKTTAASFVFGISNGSGTLVSETLAASTSWALTPPLNFIFPNASGTNTVYPYITSGSTTAISIDDCFVMPADSYNTGSTIIVTPWVAYTPTFAGFGTPTSVSFFSREVGDTLEVKGNFTSGTTTATQAQIGLGFNGTASNVVVDTTKIAPGANVGRAGQTTTGSGFFDIGILAPTTNQSYVNVGFQGSATSILTPQNGNGINGSNATFSVFFSVPIAGWGNATSFNANMAALLSDWVAYTPTFQGFGTPSGVAFYSKKVGGDLLVNGVFTTGTVTGVQAQVTLGYNGVNANVIIDTSKIGVPTIAGAVAFGTGGTASYATVLVPTTNTNYLGFGVGGTSGGTSSLANGNAFQSGSVLTFQARVPIVGWSSATSAPIVNNSITTNAAGAWRVESAHVGFTSSTCSVASGTGFATASFTTGPTCAITFTVPFSGTPTCVVSGDNEATYNALYCRGAAYTGGNSVSCFTGGTQVGDNFSIICQGPR